MHELLPVLMGAAIALGVRRVRSRLLRRALSGVLVLAAALLAVWINEETFAWPYFAVADVCFVLVGAVGMNIVLGWLPKSTVCEVVPGSCRYNSGSDKEE